MNAGKKNRGGSDFENALQHNSDNKNFKIGADNQIEDFTCRAAYESPSI